MKRRPWLLAAVTGVLTLLAGVSSPRPAPLLLLEWAGRAPAEVAPVAVLIELGLGDAKPAPWPGRASVQGGKVIAREGYRFRGEDELVAPDAWQASSHDPVQRPARRPPSRPTIIASVGVVLHLQDLQPDATLTITVEGEHKGQARVHLADVRNGKAVTLWNGKAQVRRLAAAQPLVTAPTEDDFPAAAYAPDGTLWVAYVSYRLKEERRRRAFMQLPAPPRDFRAFDRPGWDDQLFVKYYRHGRWSEPLAVTGAHEDLVRCALAAEGNGTVWVVYSAQRQGRHDLYARPVRGGEGDPQLGPERRLTRDEGRCLTPVLCTDQKGDVHLAYQNWSRGQAPELGAVARIGLLHCHDGQWTSRGFLTGPEGSGNLWYPALAAGPNGQVAVAYDVYRGGDYDVRVVIRDGNAVREHTIAASPRFEARPALAYDPQGRLWIAYEEGPEKWGKNFGALEQDRGNPLYNVRRVRVACLAGGRLLQPAELAAARPARRPGNPPPHQAYPRLGLDTKGRLWLAYRDRLPTPFGVEPGTNWLTYARRLDGDHWTEPLEIHHSDGLLDSRPVLLPHAGGGLLVVTNTDGRYSTPRHLDNQIYTAVVDLPGEPQAPQLGPKEPDPEKDSAEERLERAAVERLRHYRLEVRGKRYALRRGDFHRHTEISFDGGNDGSLEDFYRYAIDAAALDWVATTDHDSGHGREYTWWLIQKFSDAYHVPGAFTPLFAYERSVSYPMGHRNVLFARRGVLTLPRLQPAASEARVGGVAAGDTKMLYRYLKELGGLCASHTSATNMGTDWRDNDSDAEPVVEIYQGDRMSYEKQGAPRAGYDPRSGKQPANIAGWFPKGYVNLALARGYRLGFQSSSDHISTHISYSAVLTEDGSREAILAGFRQRHCYGATDDILMDLRCGDHLMGDTFATDKAPTLQFHVVGVKPLRQLHLLKDSDVVATFRPGKEDYAGSWTDKQPGRGSHYYYLRVEQADGELAWASPLWIEYRGGE